ncbi:MAG TPA: hypothetical protein VG096_26780 [Bryobacteraceae bacterium]|jgi:hypothetical protein|nr:hypothetical protein [Bryobacteraceae bacterium]
MKVILCVLMLTTCVRADIQTTTTSSLFADYYGGGLGEYTTFTELSPFDARLGTLDTVDLTIVATFQEAVHWDSMFTLAFPIFGSISYTTTGTSSFFGTTSADYTLPIYIPGACVAPACSAIAGLQFGGEEIFTGTDLNQFEASPISLSASSYVTVTSVSTGIAWPQSTNTDGLWVPGIGPGQFWPVSGYLTSM